MIFNIIGFILDILFALLSGMVGILVPKRYKKSVKRITDLVLGIEDTPDFGDRCYAVRVFDYPRARNDDLVDHSAKEKV